LLSKLEEWQYRCPWHQDEHRVDEMFPAASYQYVLYGMGFRSEVDISVRRNATLQQQQAARLAEEVRQQAHKLATHLPTHRNLLEEASIRGFAAR
jgi:tryptophan halogenase